MRIALASSFVPFVLGGARNIVEWLEIKLRDAGHEVERVYLPQVDRPDLLFRQMASYRFVDLSRADLVVCFRPPAHYIPHPRKVVWFIHHIRLMYDLWDTEYRGFPDDLKHQAIRARLHAADTAALREAQAIFTNSRVVADRLLRFNGVRGEVLYPPLLDAERFAFRRQGDEIVSVCRLVPHKRQHLLIDAMRYTKTDVRLRLAGASDSADYTAQLKRQIGDLGPDAKVTLEDRWISEEEKIELLGDCLAQAYAPVDEDSYGYPTLEAAHSSKPTLTTTDSGGVLEFVEDGLNGIIAEPNAQSLAAAMDSLFLQRDRTREMGANALLQIERLNITWPHVLERLLA